MSSSKNLNFQIGLLIGEKIVENDLITLSTDMILSMKVQEVPVDLAEKWQEKQKSYDNSYLFKGESDDNFSQFYENLNWYKQNIEVLLPKEIICRYPFEYTDEDDLVEGIELALWNSDLSHYKFDKIERGKYTNKITLRYER